MTTELCETPLVPAYEPSDELRQAKQAAEETKAASDAAVVRLHQAIADEVVNNRTADVARFMNQHPGYIRRIAKAHGVEPKVDVEPPRRRSADTADS
jgi:hypothetical protein